MWNPFQNCGQPFFAISVTGLLYPPNVFFLLLGLDGGLKAVLFVNLIVGGWFAYLLCRELGVGYLAALGGAVAFELGNATIATAAWSPMHSGPYVWLPAVTLFCERILRTPTVRRCVGLGVALTLALLPGFPQTVLFAYQLVALRLLWELVSRRSARNARTLLVLGLGLAVPPLLSAVQLIPSLEIARESVRNVALSQQETNPYGFLQLGWEAFRRWIPTREGSHTPLILLPCIVSAAALLRGKTRGVGLFYLCAGLLYFVLAFGEHTPLYGLYVKLPLGALFRDPGRFMWVSSFCLAVLTALGLDALTAPAECLAGWARYAGLIAPGVALLGFSLLNPVGLPALDCGNPLESSPIVRKLRMSASDGRAKSLLAARRKIRSWVRPNFRFRLGSQ